MIVREIIATCSNPHIARAALASIGGEFERGFARDAAARNLSAGSLASRLACAFARHADDADWDGVRKATRGQEMPVLSGLRFVLDRAREMDEERRAAPAFGAIRPDSQPHAAISCA